MKNEMIIGLPEIFLGIVIVLSFVSSYFWKRKFGKILQFYSNGTLVGMALTLWITRDLNIFWGVLALASFIYNIYTMNIYIKKHPEAKLN